MVVGFLGAGEHDGAGVGVEGVERDGGFFHGVGAVRDDDPHDGGVGQGVVAGGNDGVQVGEGEGGGIQAGEFPHLDGEVSGKSVGDGLHEGGAGYGGDQRPGGVGGAGDRAASGDDGYLGLSFIRVVLVSHGLNCAIFSGFLGVSDWGYGGDGFPETAIGGLPF